MRFLLDENEIPALLQPLRFLHPKHTFDYAPDIFGAGTLDVPLFERMRADEYDALITRDRAQLVNDDERQAIFQNQIHWIGHKKPKGNGVVMLSTLVATYAAAFPHILGILQSATESRAVNLYHTDRAAKDWIKVHDIDPLRRHFR